MKILSIFLLIVLLIILLIALFIYFHPVFWGKSQKFDSQNFYEWKFQNKHPISVETGEWWLFGILKDYIFSDTQRVPTQKIETKEFDKNLFKTGSITWFGHSTILMNVGWTTVITDPVFYEASPISVGWKPFKYSHTPEVSSLPDIDVMLISHDHYDHLDYKTIQEIDEKVSKYFVPLWVKSHLLAWNIDAQKITEFDWQDSVKVANTQFVFTPSQHFSGRALLNRSSTLWWSWAILWEKQKLYFSWDSGYFDWFKEIWEKYGPFDIAFLENGAYNDAWNKIHMYPEESVQAWIDVKAQNLMPIHWWKFDLSLHSWYEPIERFIQEADKQNKNYFHPQIWEIFTLSNLPKNNWWEDLK